MEEVGDLAFLLWDLCYRLGEDKKKEHYSFKGGREACEVSKAVRPTTSLLPIAFTTRVRRRAEESQILTYSLATAFEKTKGEKKKKIQGTKSTMSTLMELTLWQARDTRQ